MKTIILMKGAKKLKTVMINIPDAAYDAIQATKHIEGSNEATIENVLVRAVENGTLIPSDTTNGQVMQTIFPNVVFTEDTYEDEEGFTRTDIISDNGMRFELDWWNSSYQENELVDEFKAFGVRFNFGPDDYDEWC